MNKKEFINAIKDDEMKIAKIYEKLNLCLKIGKTVFTDQFYSPNVWAIVEKMNLDCNVKSYGIFKESERRILSFHSLYEENYYTDYPIKLLKITNNSKFRELKHQDYLGALMSLGIKREKFGDLLVENNLCYIAGFNEVLEYVKDNLKQIGKNPCSVEILENYEEELPTYDYEESVIQVNSLRLDNIVSQLTNNSRSNSEKLLKNGMVLVNYIEINQKSSEIKLPSTISIRGYGKYKIEEIIGQTKKGKEKITIKKFI